jgi:VWFA-related protein
MKNHRLRLAVLLALASVSALSAGQAPAPAPQPTTQQPTTQQTPPPTFKAEVEYVEVDALVTDEQGQFVRDLSVDDFQIFEDGRPQKITNFSLVDIPVEQVQQPLFATAPIEPDTQTNEEPFEGRVYVMIMDDLHTDALRSQRVKLAAREFIEKHLGSNDLMAVIHTGGRSEAAQEFTNNKRLLLASVDKFLGRKLESATLLKSERWFIGRDLGDNRADDPYEQERRTHALSTLTSLRQVSEWFGGIRGRRKTIIFLSEGIDYDIYDVFSNTSASAILADTRDAIAAATRANVSIYAVDPRGLTMLGDVDITTGGYADQERMEPATGCCTGEDPGTPPARPPNLGLRSLRSELQLSQDSLRTLAGETNGIAAVNSNQISEAFERIVRDNSSYYVLAYYPPSNRRDGRFHRISVRVNRPGLTVRARRGYAAPRGNVRPRNAVAGTSPEMLETLNNPLPVSGLTMRVFAAPFKGTAPNTSVMLGVEMRGGDLNLETNNRIELSYFAVDATGKTRGGRTENVTLNFRPETRQRVQQSGMRILSRLDLPPGRYTLRVAARDNGGGAIGALSYDLEVPDYAKPPFSMSGLVLTSMLGSALPTVRGDDQLQAVLPAPPIGLRTFPQNDEIALFTEVYDRPGNVPHRVDITATIRSNEGAVVMTLRDERSSEELEGKPGGYGYTTRIPLGELQPGLYVLTVEATSRTGEATARRDVQFTVTPRLTP